MSAKKDGMANIGGFLCTNDDQLAQQEKNLLILTEGYPRTAATPDAISRPSPSSTRRSKKITLRYRIASTAYLGNHIASARSPTSVQPPCGHAIYLDARTFLPHIPADQFPGAAQMNLVRLAIPRRVYTQSHLDYVVEVILEVWKHRENIPGMRLTYEAPFLRHFTAHLEPAPVAATRSRVVRAGGD